MLLVHNNFSVSVFIMQAADISLCDGGRGRTSVYYTFNMTTYQMR